MIRKYVAIAAALFGLLGPALADDATPDNGHGRYTFNQTAEGFLRLDVQTGDVSLCAKRAVGFACQAVPDDRTVLENEIARLRAENGALKKEILAHGITLPNVAAPESSAAPHDNDVTIRLPDNADIDRAVAYVGRLWQRFVDAIVRAQKQAFNKS